MGTRMVLAGLVGAMNQFAEKLNGALESVERVSAMVADVQVSATARADTIFRDQNLVGENDPFGPAVTHDLPPPTTAPFPPFYAGPLSSPLASFRIVVLKRGRAATAPEPLLAQPQPR